MRPEAKANALIGSVGLRNADEEEGNEALSSSLARDASRLRTSTRRAPTFVSQSRVDEDEKEEEARASLQGALLSGPTAKAAGSRTTTETAKRVAMKLSCVSREGIRSTMLATRRCVKKPCRPRGVGLTAAEATARRKFCMSAEAAEGECLTDGFQLGRLVAKMRRARSAAG